ncbi:MAG: glucosamine-6-phosphate deaminase [Oscillospiraceae bacterium]|nr:glucosamine-6-phosphate deaminase [Oscillospiraceae bacterium]
MQIIKVASYDEMSRRVADLIIAQISAKPNSVLGLATGSTPVGAYRLLRESGADFSGLTTINLDEYCGLPPTHPQSYRRFMDENLFNHINIDRSRTHVPDGMAANPAAEAERYEALIKSLGGTDLQLLGLGHNGHIAFIEPGDELPAETCRVFLDEQTIKANSRFFDSADDVPKCAISMGIKTIMNAKKIVLAVSGCDKADALKKALYGGVTTRVPASVLQLHNDIIVVTDCLG